MSNYRLVRPENGNIFYKILAVISTLGVLAIAGIQVSRALNKTNSTEDQLRKVMLALNSTRLETLAEVEKARVEVLKDLNVLKKQTLPRFKKDSSNSLRKLESEQIKILNEVKTIRADVLRELRDFECRTLVLEAE